MSIYVTDTHALYWYLTDSPNLGKNAKNAFSSGEQGRSLIYIPSIVMAELYYLNVKYGSPLDFAHEYRRFADAGQFRFSDFHASDVLRFHSLLTIPEMHDRIIAGVAYAMGAPLLTRDPEIIRSNLVQTVW